MAGATTIYNSKLKKEKEYWQEKLSGQLTPVSIPLDFKRTRPEKAPAELLRLDIAPELSQKLLKFCSDNLELFLSAAVTAVKICLHRYTGLEDIIVGSAIHKKHADATPLNRILVFRDVLNDEMSIRDLLHSVKNTLLEAYTHQKYPLESMLAEIGAISGTEGLGLLNVVVLLENINDRNHVENLKNDLTFVFAIEDGTIRGQIEYNGQLYRKEAITVLCSQYLRVLESIPDIPNQKISSLDWISPDVRHEVLIEFNRTSSEYPRDKTILQLIEEQVQRTPAALAVSTSQGSHITYVELDARANQLARYLHAQGVNPGDRVAIMLDHSIETIIGILGILKAGAVYTPLDAEHPASRTSFVLSDAAIKVLLTQEHFRDAVSDSEVVTICLDSDWNLIAAEAEAPLPLQSSADDIAYIIYTSGSTGEPKGVQIQHKALVNYIWWAKNVYLCGEKLDFPLYSSLAFDLTVTSIFLPLITGNRIVAYPQNDDVSPLLQVLEDNRVGVLKLTPSHLSLISGWDNKGSGIKRLIVGGEAFETDLARRALESFGESIEIFNEYGPTEATVGCMIHRFDPAQDTRPLMPIGNPAANTQIYVLDRYLAPTPDNVVGELFISGEGLAKGYLNRDSLTQDRFVPNPFLPGERMYATGDLARRLPEGGLEYIGRNDDQVKYHGYRVELNEIRTAINQHPSIDDSLVRIAKDARGFDVMIAYYVAKASLDAGELREFLSALILESTIPSVFIRMERLPLTVNGKVDVRALPSYEEVQRNLQREFVAPRTPTEVELAEIWSQLIGIEKVGVEDNFFALGGHSLMAAQVISRIRTTFGVDLPMRCLLDSPTISALALEITQMQINQEPDSEIAQMIEEIGRLSSVDLDNLLAQDAMPLIPTEAR